MLLRQFVGITILLVLATSISIKNQKIYDDHNREVYFHGTNVVVKVPPYIPILNAFDADFSFSEEDMANCKKWGFNAIRLGVMWAGVQPQKDTYNETYLQLMKDLVTTAGEKYGIYTIIDFHQDILAQKFCGDGVPTWLIDQVNGYRTFPFPMQLSKFKLNETGLPSWDDCLKHGWGGYYFSLDVSRNFRNLYTKGHRLNQKFTEYWKKLALTFKGNPYVIAYELINQPFVGYALRQPYLLLPSVAERVYFQNFYDQLTKQIRKIDSETPICFEPITFDQSVPIGFSHPPGGFSQKDKSILCYHYYTPPDLSLNTIDARVRDAKRLQVPSILNEFGGWDGNDVFERAESFQQSWMFWHFKDYGKGWGSQYEKFKGLKGSEGRKDQMLGSGVYNDDGTPNAELLKKLCRSYFQNVAGALISNQYTSDTGEFVGVYQANRKGTTVVYYNAQYNYPSGVGIQTYPSNAMIRFEKQESQILLTYEGDQNLRIMVKLYRL